MSAFYRQENHQTYNWPTHDQAVMAGFLYLVVITCGISSELFIRNNLYVTNDPFTTMENISSHYPLFMAGFFLDICMLIADVFVSALLYKLLRHIDSTLTLMAVIFRFLQASILGSNLMNYFSAQLILNAENIPITEPANLSYFLLEKHSYGYDLGLIFFGVSNLILGFMLVRAKKLPTMIGIGLLLAGITYILGSVTRFTSNEIYQAIQPVYIIPFVAELAFSLWLLLISPRYFLSLRQETGFNGARGRT